MISCEYFQTLRTSEQYPWLWKMSMIEYKSSQLLYIYIIYIYIYTYIYIFIGIVSLHISQLFLQKIQSQPDSWVVGNSSYEICQLKFCKFQVVMFSDKSTFATAIVNIFCKSTLSSL